MSVIAGTLKRQSWTNTGEGLVMESNDMSEPKVQSLEGQHSASHAEGIDPASHTSSSSSVYTTGCPQQRINILVCVSLGYEQEIIRQKYPVAFPAYLSTVTNGIDTFSRLSISEDLRSLSCSFPDPSFILYEDPSPDMSPGQPKQQGNILQHDWDCNLCLGGDRSCHCSSCRRIPQRVLRFKVYL